MKDLRQLVRRARFVVGEAVGNGEEAQVGPEREAVVLGRGEETEEAVVVICVEEADAEAAGEGECIS
ncbi:hypothetical protein M5K25_013317 [Dendrobium thyrsiflorum]|uniref:Uncharacterized protein n=1 Tax=Dendrobium thyrsiflorum TaxID=117978 RepID=A0ABD0USR7_DENTH